MAKKSGSGDKKASVIRDREAVAQRRAALGKALNDAHSAALSDIDDLGRMERIVGELVEASIAAALKAVTPGKQTQTQMADAQSVAVKAVARVLRRRAMSPNPKHL